MNINFLNLKGRKQRELLLLIFCLLIGFALRFYTFDQKSLWIDEIHTFNDSRDDIKGQIKFYKENPTYLHPPLFFVLTHLFYPFTNPERDLRILPLIFGTLSILIIYFLSRSFSQSIALPCTFSLAFMVYHIYFSQEGRSYSIVMFFGMVALYFLVQHLRTSRKAWLFLAALFFAMLFYTSYSSLLFIILSQMLWFYKVDDNHQKPSFYSFLIFIGLLLLFCVPWFMFLAFNYKGQSMTTLVSTDLRTSFLSVLYDLIHDWVPLLPLVIISLILLTVFPLFSRPRTNGFILLALFVIPVVGLYLFHKVFNIYHHFSSKYLINFLPLFFILTYLSLSTIEAKLERFNRLMRLKLLFLIVFISSNLVILPLYYSSEKQDLRGLVAYLRNHVQDGDKIVVLGGGAHLIGMVHYFGVYPEGRGYVFPAKRVSEKEIEYRIFLMNKDRKFMISNSITYWFRYLTEQNRLWIVIGKADAKRFQKDSPFTLRAFFDGSYLNYNKFPTDASMYLFLWDPKSPDMKGIDLPIN